MVDQYPSIPRLSLGILLLQPNVVAYLEKRTALTDSRKVVCGGQIQSESHFRRKCGLTLNGMTKHQPPDVASMANDDRITKRNDLPLCGAGCARSHVLHEYPY